MQPQQQQPQHQQQQAAAVTLIPATGVQPISPGMYGYAGPRSVVVVSYLSKQSMGLGVTLVVCGILAFIFNGVAISCDDYIAFVGHGFWTGVMIVITGGFGIAAAVHRTRCPIITFMVLAIVTAVLTTCLLSLGIVGAVRNDCSDRYGYGCGGGYDYHYSSYSCGYYRPCSSRMRTATAMESLLAVIALVSGVACIWGSAICCKAVCCCYSTSPGYTPAYGVVYTAPYTGQQTVVLYNQPQGPAGPAPYLARPQIAPAAPTGPTAPPPYVANGYTVQYWGQQQQQPTGQSFAYASAPFSAQMPTTSLGTPPAYPGAEGQQQQPTDNKM